jgi:mitochondrial fission protein ELM1
VLADDRPGNRSQCLGVAEALELPFAVKEIAYTALAATPNLLLGDSLLGVTAETREALRPPLPDLVIAAGRRTARISLALKRQAGHPLFAVQLMDPGGRNRKFDLIAIPKHDRRPVRANVVETVGAPHRVTAAVLARERAGWEPRCQGLPKPWIALLVGGSSGRRKFTAETAQALGSAASRLAALAGGSLLISTSRRTGAAAADLFAAIQVPHRGYRWGDGGDNPYLGFLAVADAIVVTGDSMSMCSEACAGSAPVYIFAPPGLASDKHTRLHQDLFALGLARPFGEALDPWSHPPWNPAATVAAEIRRRLQLA